MKRMNPPKIIIADDELFIRLIARNVLGKSYTVIEAGDGEAAINLATTSPSVKVVDYGLTSSKPLSPRKSIVYPLSLMLGVVLPYIFLFIRFSLDTKVQGRVDLEKLSPEIPIFRRDSTY